MYNLIQLNKRREYLHDIRDLTVGGHCGCCGRWIDKAIVEKGWEWTLCPDDKDACYNKPIVQELGI